MVEVTKGLVEIAATFTYPLSEREGLGVCRKGQIVERSKNGDWVRFHSVCFFLTFPKKTLSLYELWKPEKVVKITTTTFGQAVLIKLVPKEGLRDSQNFFSQYCIVNTGQKSSKLMQSSFHTIGLQSEKCSLWSLRVGNTDKKGIL